MAIYDTKGTIEFNNVSVSYQNTTLVGDIDNQITRLNEAESRRRLFRSDLAMLAEGDLWTTKEPLESKDLMVVSGLLNFAQAVTHRLMTPRGYHPADPSFGVPWYDYLGQVVGHKAVVEAQLMADVTEELSKDPRTGAVLKVSVEFEGQDTISVVCYVAPAAARDQVITLSMTAGV